jgi:hypothetical protein
LVVGQGPTQEERLKALQENLDVLRQSKERANTPQNSHTPSPRSR